MQARRPPPLHKPSASKSRSPARSLTSSLLKQRNSTHKSSIDVGGSVHKNPQPAREVSSAVSKKKNSAACLSNAKKEAQLVKQSLMSARHFMRNDSQRNDHYSSCAKSRQSLDHSTSHPHSHSHHQSLKSTSTTPNVAPSKHIQMQSISGHSFTESLPKQHTAKVYKKSVLDKVPLMDIDGGQSTSSRAHGSTQDNCRSGLADPVGARNTTNFFIANKQHNRQQQQQNGSKMHQSVSSVSVRTQALPKSGLPTHGDVAKGKSNMRSPRQVQIEFMENEELELLRKEASEDKQSQITDNLSQIMNKEPNLSIDQSLLKDLKKFDNGQYTCKSFQTDRPAINNYVEVKQQTPVQEKDVLPPPPISSHGESKMSFRKELEINPDQASLELFNSIFGDIFQNGTVDKQTGRVYITKAQYESTVIELTESTVSNNQSESSRKECQQDPEPDAADHRNHLMSLFSRADPNRKGIVYRDDLLKVLKEDLVRVYHNQSIDNSNDRLVEQQSVSSALSHRSRRSECENNAPSVRVVNSTFRESLGAESLCFQSIPQGSIIQYNAPKNDQTEKAAASANYQHDTPKILHKIQGNHEQFQNQFQQQQQPVQMIASPFTNKRASRKTNGGPSLNSDVIQKEEQGITNEQYNKNFEKTMPNKVIKTINQHDLDQKNNLKYSQKTADIDQNIAQIQPIQRIQSTNSSRKSDLVEKQHQESTKAATFRNMINSSPKKASRGQFIDDQNQQIVSRDLDDYNTGNLPVPQKIKERTIEKNQNENNVESQPSAFQVPKPQKRTHSFLELQKSTYFGALDLINMQGNKEESWVDCGDDTNGNQFNMNDVIMQQSNLIFKEIFEPFLNIQSKSSLCDPQKIANNKIIITHDKFEEAVTSYFTHSEDLAILRDLYLRSDMHGKGFVTKDQLIQSLQFEIQTSCQNPSNLSHSLSIDATFSRSKVANINQLSQNDHKNLDKIKHKFQENNQMVAKRNAQDHLTHQTNQSTLEYGDRQNTEEIEGDKVEESPEMIKQRLISSGKDESNPRNDPILLWLLNHEMTQSKGPDPKASQNLTQVIEYVSKYKLEQYHTQLPSLEFLFDILLKQSIKASKQYDLIEANLDQLRQQVQNQQEESKAKAKAQDLNLRAQDSFREYALKDINAQAIKNLECEVDRLKAFEMMYHAQQRKLDQSIQETHELETERDNLQALNQDLLNDYEAVKKDRDRCQVEARKDAIQIKEMTKLIANLKEQVLNNFKGDGKHRSEDEYTNDVGDSDLESARVSLLDDAESPLPSTDAMGRDVLAPLQPNRRWNQSQNEQDISMSDPESRSKILSSNQKLATKLEIQMLEDLETTEVFKMRDQIEHYIRQHVWLEREGHQIQVKSLKEGNRRDRKQIAQQNVEILKLKSEISTLKQICQDLEDRNNQNVQNQENLKQQLMDLTQQHQKINHDKSRLIGVNQILEQKLKIEKSEKLSMINDIEQLEMQDELQGGAMDPNQSIMSGMSGISRLSMKYSGQRAAGRMTSFIKQTKHNLSMRKTPHLKDRQQALHLRLQNTGRRSRRDNNVDQLSINSQQALWIKNRVREEADFDQYSQFQENAMEGYDIDFSQMSAIKSRRNGDDAYELDSNQFNQSQSINMSHFQSQILESNETAAQQKHNKRNSFIQKCTTDTFNQQSINSFRDNEDGGRVQVISDFDSQDNDEDDRYSIEMMSQMDLARINENIKKIQIGKTAKEGSTQINYDLLGIRDPAHKLHQQIEALIQKEFQMKERRSLMAKSLKQVEGPIFSDRIHLYQNKKLKELLIIILQGNIYFIQEKEESVSMHIKPFNFLDDITKIIYSERHPRYLALKLRDLRKFGDTDHLVIEISNRELLADFMMEHAEKLEDDVVFELNEEFSMLVKYQPLWFSFDDVDQCKKQEQKVLFNSEQNTMTGFLEIRQNKSVNILKSLFRGQSANWERKYCVLRGFRLHVYAVQKAGTDYTKPEKIVTLSKNLSFQEAKKADVGGKSYVITLCSDSKAPADQKETLHLGCSGLQILKKWINGFKKVEELYNKASKIKEELDKEQKVQKLKGRSPAKCQLPQSRFQTGASTTTGRNLTLKAKSKVADQKVPSNGSSAVKDGHPGGDPEEVNGGGGDDQRKAMQNTTLISHDFNAFAMEQIMMADGVTGSLRVNLEKRMQKGFDNGDLQSENVNINDNPGTDNMQVVSDTSNYVDDDEDEDDDRDMNEMTIPDNEDEDPYNLVMQQSVPSSTPLNHMPKPPAAPTTPTSMTGVGNQTSQNPSDRIRRGRGSRCSSRLTTTQSGKKESQCAVPEENSAEKGSGVSDLRGPNTKDYQFY